jgi:allantoinase
LVSFVSFVFDVTVIVRSRRVVFPDGVRPATIHTQHGKIARIGAYDEWSALAGLKLGEDGPSEGRTASAERFDADDFVVSPGLVDTHVHVNEPGRTEWEGFDTATRAAAAGGVTTIVDMPLNSVPATTTVAALEAKRSAARGRCQVDVAFWGGVVPGNAADLDGLVDAGVRGFKCFLVPSGVDEFPAVGERDLRDAMPILAKRGVPLLVHAESPALIRGVADADSTRLRSDQPFRASAGQAYATYLATRPPEAEVEAIRLMVRLAQEFGARVHIVHVASAEAADEVARAKVAGVAITAETCPHYLAFEAEQISDGATEFKCAPPIREARHRQALWNALAAGTLELVATDHSPAPPALKCPGDFMRAWGGIASLELSLAAVWSSWTAPSLRALSDWMSAAPARLAGLADRKGRIAPGYDADLVVWDPDAEWTVEPDRLQQRHKLTPYAGRRLRGRVQTTLLRGTPVWDAGRLVTAGCGQLL